jgi:pimeloyl-ACP methyl ester carboxylesterase
LSGWAWSAALAPVLLYACGLVLRRRHRLDTPCDERAYAPTDDGWRIALHRYRPRGGAGAPVLLCHGLLSNRFNVDLDDEHSLARDLRRRGFDVFVMELRGHGGSRRDNGRVRPFDWTLDDYVRRDFKAAVDEVRRLTGADRIFYFGHSLGGMILYAAAAVGLTGGIRAAVLGDAPADFSRLQWRAWFRLLSFRGVPIVPPILFIPFALVLAWVTPERLLPRYGIRHRRTLLRIVANGLVNLGSAKAARQLAQTLERGRFASADGAVDYEAGIGRIDFPLMQLAAPTRFSSEAVARAAIDRATRSPAAKLVRLGREEGFGEDYNHFTLLLGERARQEVYPLIGEFFARHGTGREAGPHA